MKAHRLITRMLSLPKAKALVAAGLISLCAAVPHTANAVAYYVGTTADERDGGDCTNPANTNCSIREAVMAATTSSSTPHTIDIPAGTYTITFLGEDYEVTTLANSDGDFDINKATTIRGAGNGSNPSVDTIIQGHASGSRIFHKGGNVPLTLEDMRLQNGNVTTLGTKDGGCILSDYNTVTLTRVTMTNCQANRGGGIFHGQTGSSLVVVDSELSNNTAHDADVAHSGGGAIWARHGVTISSSTFDGNISESNGGAIFTIEGLTVNNAGSNGNSVFTNNEARGTGGDSYRGYGGAIANLSNSTDDDVYISNATFTGNTAAQLGGAIGNHTNSSSNSTKSTTFLTDVTLTSNSSTDNGGASFARGSTEVERITASGNTSNQGGALLAWQTMVVKNSTFYNNEGTTQGGAVYGGTLTANNNTFSDNKSTSGVTAIFASSGSPSNNIFHNTTKKDRNFCQGVNNAGGYNVIYDGSGGTGVCYSTPNNDQTGDPKLQALADNGGNTQTMAIISGSSAIDRCNDATDELYDQRGTTRSDIGGVGSSTCDIGAYEYELSVIADHVCGSGCEFTTIQAAIDDSGTVNGSTITVHDGAYGENINFNGKNITLISQNGSSLTSITGGANSPVVTFSSGEGTTAVLDGFTINNTYHSGGTSFGIYISGTSGPTIKNSTVTGNVTNLVHGAGIVIDSATSGTTTIDTVTVSSNSSKYSGPGIYIKSSSQQVDILNSTINNNTGAETNGGGIAAVSSTGIINVNNSNIHTNSATAGLGGGIHCNNCSDMRLSNTNVYNNTNSSSFSSNRGAGIAVSAGGKVTVTGGNIYKNTHTTRGGGGVYITGSSSQFIGNKCRIEGNKGVDNGGGGVLIESSGTATITNCFITGNVATSGTWAMGGGIYNNGGTLNLYFSTIAGNYAQKYGGGIATNNTTSTVDSSIIWDNLAAGGGNDYYNYAGTSNASYSAIESGTYTAGTGVITSLTGTVFVTGIAASTTPKNSVDDGVNYHLKTDAVEAINSANPSPSPANDTDFDGDSRPQGSGYEMGADEHIQAESAPTNTFTSGTYDSSTNTLVFTGTNFDTIATVGTDVKSYMDWTKFSWDINGDNTTTANISVAEADVTSLTITNATTLTLVFTTTKANDEIETTAGVGIDGNADTLDITAGFSRASGGTPSTTDALSDGALTVDSHEFNVTKTADTLDGSCTIADCSLREAIAGANAVSGANVINIPANISSVPFDITRSGSDNTNTNGDFDITDPVTIRGAGSASTTIRAGSSVATAIDRIFHVTNTSAVTIEDVKLQYGKISAQGGCVYAATDITFKNTVVDSCQATSNQGGAIYTAGAITLDNSTVSNGYAGTGAGGIWTHGMTIVNGATISNNHAVNYGGGVFNEGTTNPINGSGTINFTSNTTDKNTNDYGGAIYSKSNIVFTGSVTFSSNEARKGGAVFVEGKTFQAENATFNDNLASNEGAGALLASGITLTGNTTFQRNSAPNWGGGILNESGTVSIDGGTVLFDDNDAGTDSDTDYGGAIYSAGPIEINLTSGSATFKNNGNSAWKGGAIYGASTVAVNNATFSSNSTVGVGGAIHSIGLTVTNSTFSGNTSGTNGGAIFNDNGSIAITNSTFSANTTGGSSAGGAIYDRLGNSCTITASTFFANTAGNTADALKLNSCTITHTIIDGNTGTNNNCSGTITSGGYNIENKNTCSFSGTGDHFDTDPLLAALADNGGPTQTHALLAGSDAIDGGLDTVCTSSPINSLDQRGETRPANNTADPNECDIGAYEHQGGALSITISGRLFAADEATPITSQDQTVRLYVNGSDTGKTDITDELGDYSFSQATASGDVITVYLEGETEDATSVTVTDGATNITNLHLAYKHLVLYHHTGSSITNTHLDSADGDGSNAEILFTSTGGNLTVDSGVEVLVLAAHTFAPGGNVTTQGAGGHMDINGTLTAAASSTITVSGNWDIAGTFTASTSLVSLSGAANQTVTTNGQAFNNLTIANTGTDGTDDNAIISGALDVNGTLTITDGDLDISTNNPTVNTAGDVTISTNGSIDVSSRTLAWTFDGTSTYTDNNATTNDIKDVVITGTSNAVTLASNIKMKTLDIQADTTLNLGNIGNIIEIYGTGSTPASGAGTLNAGTDSTFKYTGTGVTTTIVASAYDNLMLAPTAATTFELAGALDGATALTGDLTIGNNATLDTTAANSYAITVAGNFDQSSDSSTMVANSSVISVGGNFTADGTTGGSANYNNATLKMTGTGSVEFQALSAHWGNGFNDFYVGQSGGLTTLLNTIAIRNRMYVGTGQITSNAAYALYLLGTTPLDVNAASTISVGTLDFFSGGAQTIPHLPNGYNTNIRVGAHGSTLTQTGNVATSAGKYLLVDGDNFAARVVTYNTAGYDLVIGGDLLLGASTEDTGTKTLNISNSDVSVGGHFDVRTGTNVITEAGSTITFNGANAQTIVTRGEALNNVVVTNDNATVTFNDASTDGFTANDFTATTAYTSLAFKENTTFTINGTLSLNGQAVSSEVVLQSTTPGTRFTLDVTAGDQYVSYVNVKDSQVNSNDIYASYSVDSGNTDKTDLASTAQWVFVSNITVSGTVYDGEGSSPYLTQDKVVRLYVNGNSIGTDATDASGVYTFSAPVAPNQTVLVYLEGVTEDGAAVTVSDGATALNDLHIYKNHLIVRHDNGGVMSNTLLDDAEGAGAAEMLFSVTTGVLTVSTNTELFIPTGHTFTPGGNLSTPDIKINGTLTPEANTLTVSGNWDMTNGTFNEGTSTVDFTGSGTISNDNAVWWGKRFYNINAAAASQTSTILAGRGIVVKNVFTLGTGTLAGGGVILSKSSGTPLVTAGATLSNGTFKYDGNTGPIAITAAAYPTLHLAGNAATNTFELAGNISCTNLQVWGNGANQTAVLDTTTSNHSITCNSATIGISGGNKYGTVKLNGSTMDIATTVTINASDVSGTNTLDGDSGNIFVGSTWTNNDVFNSDTSTVTFDAASGTINITPNGTGVDRDFYNLTFNDGGGSTTFALQEAIDVDNDLTITDGIVDTHSTNNYAVTVGNHYNQSGGQMQANSSVLTIGGNFAADGTDLTTGYQSATVTLTGAGNFSYNVASPWLAANGVYNLNAGQSGNTTTLLSQIAIGNVLAVGNGTFGVNKHNVYVFVQDSLSLNASASLTNFDLRFFGTGTQHLPAHTYDCNIEVANNGLTVLQTGNVTIDSGKYLQIGDNADRDIYYDTGGFSLTVDGNVTVGAGDDTAIKRMTISSSTLTVNGDLEIKPMGTGTVQAEMVTTNSVLMLTGSGDQTITSSGTAFRHVSIVNTGADGTTDNIIIADEMDINGNLTVSNGDLDLSTHNPALNVFGNMTIGSNGSVDSTSRTSLITFDGNGSLYDHSSSGPQQLQDVKLSGWIGLGTSVKVKTLDITGTGNWRMYNSGYVLDITGTGTPFTNAGTFTRDSNSKVRYSGSGAAVTVTPVAYHDLEFSPSVATTYTLGGALASTTAMNGDLTIGANATLDTSTNNYGLEFVSLTNNGTLNGRASAIKASGNWNNASNNFTAGTSTVTLTGGDQTISGDSDFYNLSKTVTAPATLTFAAGSTTTILANGDITLTGDTVDGDLLTLASGTPTSYWFIVIDENATKDIQYVSVSWSNNSGAFHTPIDPANSTGSDTIGWFTPAAPDISILKTSAITSDGVSVTNPKRIPGAIITYDIIVTNNGNASPDANSILIEATIDTAEEEFNNAAGIGFIDGGTASALTLGTTVYSNNSGSTYVYSPVGSFDPAVTNIQFPTSGTFAHSGASFTLRYQTRVK